MKAANISGKRFGRLVAVSSTSTHKYGRVWLCECDCGSTASVMAGKLIQGKTRSCGCLAKELLGNRLRTHGQSKTPEYRVYKNMICRCENKNRKSYMYYGGRGVSVCKRWRTSFSNFIADMGPRPSPTHTIDRIDGDDSYNPDNCRWATRQTQSENRRNCIYITYHGKTLTAKGWSRIVKFSDTTIRRKVRQGLPPEEFLSA